MMSQIHFKVAWLLLVPGDSFHGDVSGYLMGTFRAFAGKARLVTRRGAFFGSRNFLGGILAFYALAIGLSLTLKDPREEIVGY